MTEKIPSIPPLSPEEIRDALKVLESKGMLYYAQTGIYAPSEKGWKLLFGKGPIKEEIIGYGNEEISATSKEEIKISKKIEKGDSIICVKANKACIDLKKETIETLKTSCIVNFRIEVEGIEETIVGYGSPALKIENKEFLAIRKDDEIKDDTIAILCDKAAKDLKKELVEKLRNPSNQVKITIEII